MSPLLLVGYWLLVAIAWVAVALLIAIGCAIVALAIRGARRDLQTRKAPK